MADRGTYKRQTFNPEIHCGAAKDRSIETLTSRRDQCLAKIDELRALAETEELKINQKVQLKRKLQRANFYGIEIGKIEKYGPDDRPCMNRKGKKTTHPGDGLCYSHCDCKGKDSYHLGNKLNYGRKAHDRQLRAVMDALEAEQTDLLDMMPEMLLLKAKVVLFCKDKQDHEPETVGSLTKLLEQIRKTVETANAKKLASMLSIETYNLILMRMGEVVSEFVQDPEVLEKILSRWERISVETAPKRIQAALSAGRANE